MKVFYNITYINSEVNPSFSWLLPKFTLKDIGMSIFITLMFSSCFYVAPRRTTLTLIPVVSMSLFPSWGSVVNTLVFPIKIGINIITNPTSVISTVFKESYNFSTSILSGVGKLFFLYKDNLFTFNEIPKESSLNTVDVATSAVSNIKTIINETLPNLEKTETYLKNELVMRKYDQAYYEAKQELYEVEIRKALSYQYLREDFQKLIYIRENSDLYKRYETLYGSGNEGYNLFSRRVTETLCKVIISTGTYYCLTKGILVIFPNIDKSLVEMSKLLYLSATTLETLTLCFNDQVVKELNVTPKIETCLEAYENANKDVKIIRKL